MKRWLKYGLIGAVFIFIVELLSIFVFPILIDVLYIFHISIAIIFDKLFGLGYSVWGVVWGSHGFNVGVLGVILMSVFFFLICALVGAIIDKIMKK